MKMSSKSRRKCANLETPVSITPEFIARIKLLPSNVKTDYLKEQFLTKFVSSETDSADLRQSRAVEKWLKAEEVNAETNDRILNTCDGFTILPHIGYGRFVSWTQQFIESVIGAVPPLSSLIGEFSGGSSTSRRRKESHPALKYYGKAHATPSAIRVFETVVVDEVPGWKYLMEGITHPKYARESWWDAPEQESSKWLSRPLKLVEVPGNVMFTVPKNAEIDRCACKEPDINMWLQKGVGNHFRQGLRKAGINLNDQSINRRLAKVGSTDGSLATLDLSSASDSITTSLVETLLPPLWYSLLSDLRSPVTDVIGKGPHRNEMFSSMGNGFTFELESLLFFALAKATARFCGVSGVISVYGDDLIVPTALTQDLIWILNYFGFSVNSAKSFWEGPFRESCGGHYFDGRDVTPFYLRAPMGVLSDVIHMANSLRDWSRGSDGFAINDPDVYDIWVWLKSFIPEKFHGGRDYSFKYRLVTPDMPRFQLVARKKDVRTGVGGYTHWLNSTFRRDTLTEAVETSIRSIEFRLYRVRLVSEVKTSLPDRFLEELLA